MDFSTEFVALRDKLLNGQDPNFRSQQNVQVSGRMAALLSVFNSRTPRKILGLMPTGGTSHAHEYRLLFAVPSLNEQALDDWWKYAQQVSAELVKPDENHDFSLLSVILAAGEIDKSVLNELKAEKNCSDEKLKKLSDERKYQSGKHGWSSIRLAVVDLDTHKVHTNRMGDSLKNILQPLV